MKNKFKWNSDKIVSVCAILISFMTLFVFIYQTNIIREQQRMSVLPYLSLGNYKTGNPDYQYVLMNNGIGPAFIESVTIHYEGKKYNTDLPRFFGTYIPEMKEIDSVYHSNLNPGQLIPAGEKIPIFQAANSMINAKKIYDLIHRLDITMEIIYASAYGERWLLSSEKSIPEKIE